MDGPEFPYSVGPEDQPINFHMNASDQLSMYKDNEKYQKAPPILPYHLQQINQLLGDTFTNLVEVRNMLAAAKSNENIAGGVIDNINSKIDQINELLLDIPEDMAKIAI